MKTLMIPLAVVAALTGTAGLAQGGPGQAFEFSDLDLDGNGGLTREELQAAPRQVFANADSDGSGGLSVDEMIAAAETRRGERAEDRLGRMVGRFDADGDGELSFAEMQAMRHGGRNPGEIFDRMDLDENGVVTEAEFDMAREAAGARRG